MGALSLGQVSNVAPDYGKAKKAAASIFAILDRKSSIDAFAEDGDKLVSTYCNMIVT